MRKIEKNTEPREWTAYRLTPNATYKALSELRTALLQEQGYVCAYCMRRIPTKDTNSDEGSRIEHIHSRRNHEELQLDYQNMVICCPGAISHDFHCDKLKGDKDLSFNLFDDSFFSTISYNTKDGKIKSLDSLFNSEMNRTLNLNNSLLKKNRVQTLNASIDYLNKSKWKKAKIKKFLTDWNTKNEKGQFRPYQGIVVWYLNKKLSQL